MKWVHSETAQILIYNDRRESQEYYYSFDPIPIWYFEHIGKLPVYADICFSGHNQWLCGPLSETVSLVNTDISYSVQRRERLMRSVLTVLDSRLRIVFMLADTDFWSSVDSSLRWHFLYYLPIKQAQHYKYLSAMLKYHILNHCFSIQWHKITHIRSRKRWDLCVLSQILLSYESSTSLSTIFQAGLHIFSVTSLAPCPLLYFL